MTRRIFMIIGVDIIYASCTYCMTTYPHFLSSALTAQYNFCRIAGLGMYQALASSRPSSCLQYYILDAHGRSVACASRRDSFPAFYASSHCTDTPNIQIRLFAAMRFYYLYSLLSPLALPVLFPARTRGIYSNPKWLAFSSSCSVLCLLCGPEPSPAPSPTGPPRTPLRVHFRPAYTSRITTTPPPLPLNLSP